MEKGLKKLRASFVVAILSMLFAGMFRITAYAGDVFEIEQISVNAPEVMVYLRSDETLTADDLALWLGDRQLTIEKIDRFDEEMLLTDYFVLVDVSNSIKSNYTEKIKSVLSDFFQELKPGDKLVLITFGKEVDVVLEGEEDNEERTAALSAIHNKDNETKLFEAIMSVADLADKMQDSNRKICLVISDGEDFSVGTSTNSEAQKALRDRNIPVYAMGVKNTAKENLTAFGEVARELGGYLIVFDASETKTAIEEFQNAWRDTWLIEAMAPDNIVNYQMNDMMVKYLPSGISRTKSVMLDSYVADIDSPRIINIVKTGNETLRVDFSEPVQNAENAAAWKGGFDGENLFIASAQYSDSAQQSVQLTFGKVLYEGDYEVSAPGVTDVSMEKNAVKDIKSVHLEGESVPEEEASVITQTEIVQVPVSGWQKWGWVILLVIVVALFTFLIILWRIIKKRKGVVYVDDKAVLVSNIDQRQRIHIQQTNNQAEQTQLILDFVGQEGKRISHSFTNSMIVGRSEMCDLSLTDEKLSRQHFALEKSGDNLLISDLNSTNGTRVNGLVVKKSFKLSQGDVISVGNLKMRITWKN